MRKVNVDFLNGCTVCEGPEACLPIHRDGHNLLMVTNNRDNAINAHLFQTSKSRLSKVDNFTFRWNAGAKNVSTAKQLMGERNIFLPVDAYLAVRTLRGRNK